MKVPNVYHTMWMFISGFHEADVLYLGYLTHQFCYLSFINYCMPSHLEGLSHYHDSHDTLSMIWLMLVPYGVGLDQIYLGTQLRQRSDATRVSGTYMYSGSDGHPGNWSVPCVIYGMTIPENFQF